MYIRIYRERLYRSRGSRLSRSASHAAWIDLIMSFSTKLPTPRLPLLYRPILSLYSLLLFISPTLARLRTQIYVRVIICVCVYLYTFSNLSSSLETNSIHNIIIQGTRSSTAHWHAKRLKKRIRRELVYINPLKEWSARESVK